MPDHRRPQHSPQAFEQDSGEPDLDAGYTTAHNAFMDHVSGCYKCRNQGVDCQDVGPIKARLRETRSASLAARSGNR